MKLRRIFLPGASALLASLVQAGVLHVDATATGLGDGSSWADAFPELQDALAAAQAGDQVWVAAGTYRPDRGAGLLAGDRALSFELASGVELYGGFAGVEASLQERAGLYEATVLTGDLADDDASVGQDENSFHVVRAEGANASALLDGFRITAGRANGLDPRGAGLRVVGGAPQVRNCSFEANRADVAGGGVLLEQTTALLEDCSVRANAVELPGAGSFAYGGGVAIEGGAPRFAHCDFVDNRVGIAEGSGFARGGGLYATNGAPELLDCAFVSNRAALAAGGGFGQGGAVYLEQFTQAVFVRCSFEDNVAESLAFAEGGALAARFGCSPSLVSCTFAGNRALGLGSGGAVHLRDDCDPRFENCVFSANVASGEGGALFVWDVQSVPALSNCSLAANSAQLGGALRLREASPVLINSCVLWDNQDASGGGELAQLSGGAPLLDHCCVEGWSGSLGGEGNFGADPLFLDVDGADDVLGTLDDDLRLDAGSPCVDAGDTLALPLDLQDLDGDGITIEELPLDASGNARRLDDPQVADAGTGVAPLLDIGALERIPITFFGDVAAISGLTGGTQQLSLDLGPLGAGFSYFVMGCTSGSTPGFEFGGFDVPINLDDYTTFTLLAPNTPPLSGSLGLLDAAGRGAAQFALPGGAPAAVVGVSFTHAFLAFELKPGLLELRHVSNAVSVTLTP